MRSALLVAALLQAAGTQAPSPTPLAASATIRGTLAGGRPVLYVIDVPADQAARVTVQQDGIDVGVNLRERGVPLEHGLDLVSGPAGIERAFVPVSAAPTTWIVRLAAALPRGSGDYAISLDIVPADDRARALGAAYALHHQASDSGWGGDGPSFQRAQQEYAEAANAARAAGDTELEAESVYQEARVHDLLGDQLGAIELQRRALQLFRSIGRRDREARVLNRLGDLSRKLGEVAASEQYFKEALPLARLLQDPVTVADILNNSGLLMAATGRVEAGLEQLLAAIPTAQEVDSANVEGALWMNAGDCYARLGMYDKATEMYEAGVQVIRRLNIPARTARSTTTLAGAYFENGNRRAADAAIATALDLYEKSSNRTGLAETQATFGRILYASGEIDRAIEQFAQALPVLHDAQNRFPEASVLTTWADVEVQRGDTRAALPKLEEALRLARQLGNPQIERQALYLRALVFQKEGRLDDAVQSIAEATRSVETAREALRRTELRTSLLATVRRYFDLHVDLLQQKGSTAAAFEVSERGRARSLLDGLAESASKIEKGVDPQLLARERQVQAELNGKESYRSQIALRDGEKSPRVLAVSREIDRLLDQWNGVRATIRASSPAFAELRTPEPVTVARVQRELLDAGTALVEYHLGSARSYAWVIDRGSITVHALPPAEQIDDIARRYHELLSREIDALGGPARARLLEDVKALGRRLSAAAWRPIEARVQGKRLLIVADGVLQYVPFAALPLSTGEPLIVRHEIAYLPSASVLDSLRRHSVRSVQAGTTAAVFADPVFSKNDPRFAGRRDVTAPAQSRAGDGGLYGRLRFSRDEARAIGALSPRTFEALDFTAAKHTVMTRDLRQYRVLHFATHGSLNAARPELSGLVFSLVDSGGRPVDGFLRLHEIYNLDLDADLVVLSACRTALGQEVHGEGLIGLTRGFMYAGASRVVSSVWNVDDRASAQLMTRFYDAMFTKHLPPASALRDAQVALLKEPRWSNPHYWAAFGLHGDLE